jgi:hypothetical protein
MGSQNKSGETAGTPAADPKELSERCQIHSRPWHFGYLAIKLGNPQVPQRY